MQRNSAGLGHLGVLVGVIALLDSGCTSVQPEAVYVNLDRALAVSHQPVPPGITLPAPPRAAPLVVVKQPGLPATGTGDRTLDRLKAARALIAENRGKSIAALSSMLKRLYLAQAEDEITKKDRDVQPQQDAILAAAIERMREVFEQYSYKRGPILAHVVALVRTDNLADQAIPDNADAITRHRITQANELRKQIRAIDAEYDAKADAMLAEAQKQISAEIARLEAEAAEMRKTAVAKASAEAESKANKTQTELSVQLKNLVPEKLSAIPPRQVVVPGSAPLPSLPSDKSKPIFGSLEQQRHLLDEEVEIWVRTTGRRRATDPARGKDATEEFLQWRSAHKVGP